MYSEERFRFHIAEFTVKDTGGAICHLLPIDRLHSVQLLKQGLAVADKKRSIEHRHQRAVGYVCPAVIVGFSPGSGAPLSKRAAITIGPRSMLT